MTIDLLTIDMFSTKVGQVFVIEEPGIPQIELTLIEAKSGPRYANASRTMFSLLFATQGLAVLPQRIYALRHSTLGLQSIFLVPVGKDGDRVTYEAIFN